jgi:hypothetical protein
MLLAALLDFETITLARGGVTLTSRVTHDDRPLFALPEVTGRFFE